jgi:hypothetical protein
MGEKRNTEKLFVGVLEGGRALEGHRCRWRIILIWIVKKYDGWMDG